MRIAFLLARFPELSQTFVLDQIVALEEQGFEVRIFAVHASESGLRHPVGRTLLDRARFADRHILSRLAQLRFLPSGMRETALRIARQRLRRRAAAESDLLLCHFGPTGLSAARTVRGMKEAAPIWTVFHGYDLSQSLKEQGEDLYRPLFEAGDRFLPISHLWAEKLARLGCPADRIQILRMGVDCDEIGFAPANWSPGDPVRILSVGRLVEKKGAEYSIRALARVARSSPDLDWRFDIGGDGPLEQPLRELIAATGLQDRISLLGPLSSGQVRERLREAHLFLLPSVVAADGDMEGIPVSLMEAMAAGVPVVSTFHSGIPELVEHEVSGLLAPERDEDVLARHLESLIRDPDHRQSLARAARLKVEKAFDQKRINREFGDRIRAALDPGRQAAQPAQGR
ncbi:glycosyltransferase [Sphingosinicella terrae]|uniref:glycosyltransferase n=1 Tax=Sphingosinicella terrae TaxID=2172047 RepID=UPI0013B3BB0D|nr:glycosyltransferase [Sphingosinicella terrae]